MVGLARLGLGLASFTGVQQKDIYELNQNIKSLD